MRVLIYFVLCPSLLATNPSTAAERIVTLNVANATCELCGPIVRRALTRTSGVLGVQVMDVAGKTVATVHYDDDRTDIPSLISATTNAGYPSTEAQ